MQAEATLDPSDLSTRKVERMSDLVAEMVLGACADDDESSAAAIADAAALRAARTVTITPPAPPVIASPVVAPAITAHPVLRLPDEVDVERETHALDGSRRRVRVAALMTFGALVLAGSAIVALVIR